MLQVMAPPAIQLMLLFIGFLDVGFPDQITATDISTLKGDNQTLKGQLLSRNTFAPNCSNRFILVQLELIVVQPGLFVITSQVSVIVDLTMMMVSNVMSKG